MASAGEYYYTFEKESPISPSQTLSTKDKRECVPAQLWTQYYPNIKTGNDIKRKL